MKEGRSIETLSVRLALEGDEVDVGTLAWSLTRRVAAFEFRPSFLATGLEISPLRLPLGGGLRLATRQPFEGLHGVFADSLPDGWGRLLVDRMVRSKGVDAFTLSPLDRLSLVGRAGMGALTYRPEALKRRKAGAFDLDALARDTLAVLDGEGIVDIERLVHANGSSAGARPKAMVLRERKTGALRLDGGQCSHEGEEAWLVKFRSREDAETAGRVEHAYALMARSAGIDFPETLVLEGTSGAGYFAARRFDRTSKGSRHVLTLSGMLDADHRTPSVEYDDLLKATMAVTGAQAQVEEAFRRMVFNVIAGNRDDHAKNHAFLMGADGLWTLAPAYDVTLSSGPGGEHAMAISGEGRKPKARDIAAVAERASISKGTSDTIVGQVVEAVRLWRSQAEAAGVPEPHALRIGRLLSDNAGAASAAGRTPSRTKIDPLGL